MPRLHLAVLTTRNETWTFAKTDFQVLKLKFHSWNFKQAFYPLHIAYLDSTKILLCKFFVWYLVVKPACV